MKGKVKKFKCSKGTFYEWNKKEVKPIKLLIPFSVIMTTPNAFEKACKMCKVKPEDVEMTVISGL